MWSVSPSVCLRGPAAVVRPALPLVGQDWRPPAPRSLLLPRAEEGRVSQAGAQGGQRPGVKKRGGARGAWGGQAGSGWVSVSGRVWGVPKQGKVNIWRQVEKLGSWPGPKGTTEGSGRGDVG